MKKGDYLVVANQIYQQIFNLIWVNNIEKNLQEDIMVDPLNTPFDREVHILIDQSGSMVKKDTIEGKREKRWNYLQERIMGHVDRLLTYQGTKDEKVCDSVFISLFGSEKSAVIMREIQDADEVENIFLENQPYTNTFIVPVLSQCLDHWFKSYESTETKGVFIIIYTDGHFDDTPDFEKLIKDTCARLEDERTSKIFIIGVGTDIDMEYFNRLNQNFNSANVDKNSRPCDIVGFDRIDEITDIIPTLERELRGF